jgi:hypothetical protein
MVSKFQQVELQLSVNLVDPDQDVILTANLSDLEMAQIKDQDGEIWFVVNGKGDDFEEQSTTNPPTATWPGRPEVGEYRAKVELRFEHGKKRDTIAHARIHVVVGAERQFTLRIEDNDEPVEEGTLVPLTIDGGPTSVEEANLHYAFDTGNQGIIVPPHRRYDGGREHDGARRRGPDRKRRRGENENEKFHLNTAGISGGTYPITVRLADEHDRTVVSTCGAMTATDSIRIKAPPVNNNVMRVALQRSSSVPTRDQAFWSLIRSATAQVSSARYADFIERALGPDDASFMGRRPAIVSRLARDARDLRTFTYGVGAYEMLKTATQIFLLLEAGGCDAEIKDLDLDDESSRFGEPVTEDELKKRLCRYLTSGHIPYIDRVLDNAFRGDREIIGLQRGGVLASRVQVPCLLELIWSYWHEEGMLVQSISAIARRFQNIRAPGGNDPLAHLEIDPLRPLSNLLWGYIQDEQNLLTVKRRAYEYDHEYGLALYGKAVPPLRSADSRSKFLEAFHHLLHRCSAFYKEDNDTTVIADGFTLLNALKEVHLLLAEGASNQFGDLPWTARAEMLIQQWLLSRPEMRDFLQGRRMVPYKEPWMAQVDTMKSLQGWTDIPVTHFRDLGVYGEQILLSIRYGDWIDINNEDSAKNWARSWRPEIQSYLHAYRAVTGMDLTNLGTVDHTMPAIHLQKRLAMQRAR